MEHAVLLSALQTCPPAWIWSNSTQSCLALFSGLVDAQVARATASHGIRLHIMSFIFLFKRIWFCDTLRQSPNTESWRQQQKDNLYCWESLHPVNPKSQQHSLCSIFANCPNVITGSMSKVQSVRYVWSEVAQLPPACTNSETLLEISNSTSTCDSENQTVMWTELWRLIPKPKEQKQLAECIWAGSSRKTGAQPPAEATLQNVKTRCLRPCWTIVQAFKLLSRSQHIWCLFRCLSHVNLDYIQTLRFVSIVPKKIILQTRLISEKTP